MVKAEKVSVGTTATELFEFTTEQVRLWVENIEASAAVFIGGPDVTTTAGFRLAAGQAQEVQGRPGDVLYGIIASATGDVRLLETGV